MMKRGRGRKERTTYLEFLVEHILVLLQSETGMFGSDTGHLALLECLEGGLDERAREGRTKER